MNDLKNDNEEAKSLRQIGAFITVPFVLAIPPVLGWFFGSWIDKKLGTEPYFMYGLVVLGFIAGFRELFRLIKRFGNGS